MKKINLLLVGLLLAGVVSAQEGDGAQPAKAQTMEQLLADRKQVKDAADGLRKGFEKMVKDFQDLPATKDFNLKQQKAQESYREVDKRLKELDTLIADKVVKDAETKK